MQCRLEDETATARLAENLAQGVQRGDLIALDGPLGVGKSLFARALIRALAGDPDLGVPSPTFTLMQCYETAPPLIHLDGWRLADPADADELGWDEALERVVTLIEWPDRFGDRLPTDRLHLTLSIEPDDARIARLVAGGPRGQRLLDHLEAQYR